MRHKFKGKQQRASELSVHPATTSRASTSTEQENSPAAAMESGTAADHVSIVPNSRRSARADRWNPTLSHFRRAPAASSRTTLSREQYSRLTDLRIVSPSSKASCPKRDRPKCSTATPRSTPKNHALLTKTTMVVTHFTHQDWALLAVLPPPVQRTKQHNYS